MKVISYWEAIGCYRQSIQLEFEMKRTGMEWIGDKKSALNRRGKIRWLICCEARA